MPELPEVETVIKELISSELLHKQIKKAKAFVPSIVGNKEQFEKLLAGKKILSILRRGKWIVIELSSGWTLLVHLRMTGRFFLKAKDEPVGKHEHVILELEDSSSLRFHDTRKFGRLYLTQDPSPILENLGIEPMSEAFSFELFKRLLSSKKRILKSFLLDQKIIAGLGNIYVDESLWLAKLHPKRLTLSLTEKEARKLYDSIKESLLKGIKYGGTSLGSGAPNFHSLNGRAGSHQNVLNVFRREGSLCPRCNQRIVKTIVAQRGTHFCPTCQMLGT